jgi:pyruvate ferredoxin oxidoreductase alpha subunit
MRLPIVMTVVNRALSSPLNVWGDHSDAMSVRDTGWIQIFTENGQEVVDNVLCAFRIAEDQKVLLPVMIHLDGFHLSHMIEPILLPEQAEVDKFIPPYHHPLPLNPDKPVSMGAFAAPILYTEGKKAQQVNLTAAKEIILQCWNDFASFFGRYYSPVECYHCEDASVLLLTMGSFSETAMVAIDKMRKEGRDVGLLKLRLWRPFPFKEIRQAVKKAKVLIVLDRALSFGGPGGPVCSEIRSALYDEENKPKVISFVGGLGGRDITVADFEEIVNKGIEISQKGSEQEFEMFGVRE